MRMPIYLATIFLVCSMACKGQTPEQQKMMEDMEKKGMEAQRQYDSVMNSPQVKKIMEQTEAMEAQAKIDRDKRNAEKQEKISKPTIPKKDYEGYIISKSNAKKFDNWSYGEADIIMAGFTSRSTDPGYKKKIGSVNTDGSFEIKLPEKVSTRGTISEYRSIGLGYFWDKGDTDYVNPGTGLFSALISIKQNDVNLGSLFIASAIELLDEWTRASDYHGIPGYRLEWYYSQGEASATANHTIERRQGKDYDIARVLNVHFKPGWNLVKISFDGPRITIDWGEGEHNKHSYYKEEKVTVVPSLPDNAKWLFHVNPY